MVEAARELPVVDEVEVIVAGGGPAGFAAAVAAARTGARVRLFEVAGCLGGVWTGGLLTWLFEFDQPGLARELTARLDRLDARRPSPGNESMYVYEVEPLKLLLEQMCLEAGVRVQLHTRLVAAEVTAGRLTGVITESKSGRQAWRARAFVDATGDGDLGLRAGCGADFGDPETGLAQPLTFNAQILVRDPAALADKISFWQGDLTSHRPAVARFREELARAGIEPSYGDPTLFQMRGPVLTLMINHEYGVDPHDAEQVTAATLRGRAEVHRVTAALRALGGPWEDARIVQTAHQIGIREGRRIHGHYTVTADDLIRGARHEDAVCRVRFNVDIHALTRQANRTAALTHGGIRTLPYDIPLRALIARDVEGLLLGGRCLSGDFMAHASYRVTGSAVATGQAAGACAGLAALTDTPPHRVPWPAVKAELERLRAAGEAG